MMDAPERKFRYFVQQNDRGDLLWLDPGTHRPEYATAEKAKKYGYVALYVEVPEPAVMPLPSPPEEQ